MSDQEKKELRLRPKAVRTRKPKKEEEKKEEKEPKKRKRANRSIIKKIDKPEPKEKEPTKKPKKSSEKRDQKKTKVEHFTRIEYHWSEWKEIFLVGTEWNIYDQTYSVNWDFDHLLEKLSNKDDADFKGKYIYMFGSTERKKDFSNF